MPGLWISPPQAQPVPALLGESLLTPEPPELWAQQPTGPHLQSPLFAILHFKNCFQPGHQNLVGVCLTQKDIYQPGPMWLPKMLINGTQLPHPAAPAAPDFF